MLIEFSTFYTNVSTTPGIKTWDMHQVPGNHVLIMDIMREQHHSDSLFCEWLTWLLDTEKVRYVHEYHYGKWNSEVYLWADNILDAIPPLGILTKLNKIIENESKSSNTSILNITQNNHD